MSNGDVGDAPNDFDVGDANQNDDSKKIDSKVYNKLMNQLKQTQNENKQLGDKINELGVFKEKFDAIEKEKADNEKKSHLEKGEFKKLYELEKEKNISLTEQLTNKDSEVANATKNLHDTWKLSAIQNALPGKIKKTEYFNFIDLEKIPINPDSGLPDKDAVQTVAGDFMKNFPELIDNSQNKSLPGNAPSSGGGGVNLDNFKKQSLKDMKSNYASLLAKKKAEMGLK